MDISVVVTTYNRSPLLQGAIESLARQATGGRFSYEVVVVDNASTDDTAEVAAALRQGLPIPIRYVREPREGVVHARNRGVREAAGGWIAFFDDDQLADPGWLRELHAVAQTQGAPCVGGRILLRLPPAPAVRLAPVCSALLGATAEASAPRRYARKEQPGTGNVLVARSLFDAVGPFDEALRSGCEDADFFRRVRRAGFGAWYAPQALAYHLIPPHRLDRSYFVWVSRRQGASYAYLDRKEGGLSRLAAGSAGRAAQATLLTAPRWALRALARDDAGALDAECLLWRAASYLREALLLAAPAAFSRRRGSARLDFRAERGRATSRGEG
jgi:GT2 family glycosyltransferase